jgi:ABC-type phosphate transport system substrate-binding protein
MGQESSVWTSRHARLPGTVTTLAAIALVACSSLESGKDVLRPSEQDAASESGPEQDAGDELDSGLAEEDAGDADEPDASCLDPLGFGGIGCWRCAADDVSSLQNACADIVCTPYDDAERIPLHDADGGLPALPAVSQDAAVPASGTPGAEPLCATLIGQGKALYVTGSTAARPFLQQVARQFAGSGVFVVYTATGSCAGVDAILNDVPMRTGSAPGDSSNALVWTSAASEGERCQLPAGGVPADLGVSDVFVQTCPGFELADPEAKLVRDTLGPIQTMAFVVPASSRERALSATAAYYTYGFGAAGGVLADGSEDAAFPRDDRILQRQASSGTQALLAAAIGVPADRWRGVTHRNSDELAANLLSVLNDVGTANQTLGILGVDYIDSRDLRAQVRILAYRDTLQGCAVYPDSTATARDRRNVRDGHYPLWGPVHFLIRSNEAGQPADPRTRQELSDAIAYLTGTKVLPNGVRMIDLYADSGLVPECAMRVTRGRDGGDIRPFRSPSPCGCLFEERVTGSSSCVRCDVQGDCAADEVCSLGYCEP